MQHACAVLHSHLWPVWLCHIFPHYLINGTISGEKLLNIKCVFRFCIKLLSETFVILRRIQGDIIWNGRRSYVKCLLLWSDFNETWNFLHRFSKSPQIQYLMKILPMGAELFHAYRHRETDRPAGGWTDKYDEAKCRFSQFRERT
jgi:hypothetical protein